MKTLIIPLLIFAVSVQAQTKQIEKLQTVQDYKYENKTWVKSGDTYTRPDTLTEVHAYQWKRNQIIAIQDYKLENNAWVKSGNVYPVPGTLTLIHALVKK